MCEGAVVSLFLVFGSLFGVTVGSHEHRSSGSWSPGLKDITSKATCRVQSTKLTSRDICVCICHELKFPLFLQHMALTLISVYSRKLILLRTF
jgi:hypothetical protein